MDGERALMLPGSDQKITLMCERRSMSQPLFMPGDPAIGDKALTGPIDWDLDPRESARIDEEIAGIFDSLLRKQRKKNMHKRMRLPAWIRAISKQAEQSVEDHEAFQAPLTQGEKAEVADGLLDLLDGPAEAFPEALALIDRVEQWRIDDAKTIPETVPNCAG